MNLISFIYLLSIQKYALKTYDELGAVLGTERTLVNKAEKIPMSMMLTLLYFIVAQCCWKIETIRNLLTCLCSGKNFILPHMIYIRFIVVPPFFHMTRQTQALEIHMLWFINVSWTATYWPSWTKHLLYINLTKLGLRFSPSPRHLHLGALSTTALSLSQHTTPL